MHPVRVHRYHSTDLKKLHCIILVMATDPACGTSGLLVAAGEYLKERRKEEIFYDKEKRDHYMSGMFHGYDMNRTMLRIGAMNMMTHGVENPFIEYRDSLSEQNADKDKYSLILANPPFKGSLDEEAVISMPLIALFGEHVIKNSGTGRDSNG